jgi:hypothetical protein
VRAFLHNNAYALDRRHGPPLVCHDDVAVAGDIAQSSTSISSSAESSSRAASRVGIGVSYIT